MDVCLEYAVVHWVHRGVFFDWLPGVRVMFQSFGSNHNMTHNHSHEEKKDDPSPSERNIKKTFTQEGRISQQKIKTKRIQ